MNFKSLKIALQISLCTTLLWSCNSNSTTTESSNSLDSNLISGETVNNPRTLNGTDTTSLPTLDFADTVHDFGAINEGDVVVYDFQFTNNGKVPLIVSSVVASCGCTTPEKPEDPIMPGEKGKIKVSFDSNGRPGTNEKTIMVANNSARANRELKIKMEVRPKKGGSLPVE